MKREEFIEMLYPEIALVAPQYGHACPKAVMCQALTETWKGNGISYLGKLNNFFGLKCGTSWKGKSINLKTKEEYTVGNITTIKDNFRVYDSVHDGIVGYFEFVNTKRYANLKGVTDVRKYLELIKADGYATASNYVDICYKQLKYIPENLTNESPLKLSNRLDEMIPVTLDGIAQEVIAGLWGTGDTRRKKLELAGFNYSQVQRRVTEIVRGGG